MSVRAAQQGGTIPLNRPLSVSAQPLLQKWAAAGVYVPLLYANGDINPPPIRQSLLIFALLLRLFGQLLALLHRPTGRS
jgi:hypothetical protein